MNIELIILAAVAVFVISRLYTVLGQRTGSEPRARRMPTQPQPAPAGEAAAHDEEEAERTQIRPAFTGPGAAGLEAIAAADADFLPDTFVRGARKAYEMIVNAYADGDRNTLKPLLDGDVYAAYDAAISAREGAPGEPLRLVRLKSARITDASLDGAKVARVAVAFEADLSDGENLRRAKEIWTFKRFVAGADPNWLLDEVETID